MNYTDFLKLKKPLQSEKYNVSIFNDNASAIDGSLSNIDKEIEVLNEHVDNENVHITNDEREKLNKIEDGAQVNTVLGIKGNAETSYRTGNINLTPENIGADVSGSADTAFNNAKEYADNNKVDKSEIDVANGVAPLDENRKIPSANIPFGGTVDEVMNGYEGVLLQNQINNLDNLKVDKSSVATSDSLGLIKSGTDIMVNEDGDVSIKDNSHKHLVSNISDLTTSAEELNILTGITASTEELNILDGATVSTNEINKLHGTDVTTDDFNKLHEVSASATEINLLDGATITTDELNVLDGITATTNELNYVDGVTSNIQTQLNSKAPLSSPALIGIPTAPTASTGTNTTQIATTAFVTSAISNGIATNDAMVIKGTIGVSGTVTTLPKTYKTGWTYRVVAAGSYAGQVCEIGDLIIALVDRNGSDNLDADWCVAQTNINGAITGMKSGDAYIDISQSGSVITIMHKDVSRTDTTSTVSLNNGDTFTAIKSITSDSKGHITGVDTETIELPAYGSLKNPYSLSVNGKTYDGSSAVDVGAIGISYGGTGATTAEEAEYNILSGMVEAASEVTDSSQVTFSYSSPSSTQGRLYWRKAIYFWEYIKNKIGSVLGLTVSNYNGNSATATRANSIMSGTTSLSDTAGTWTATIDGIAELYDGLTIKLKLATSYNSTYNTLNLNGLGAKVVWYRYGSRLTNHIPANAEILITYRSVATGTAYTPTSGALNGISCTDGWILDASYTDGNTKNTAGSTDSSSKLFLIGATTQASNPQTYSHDTAYIGTDGCLYSDNTKVCVEGHEHNYAGSSISSGSANSAVKLDTSAGSTTQPVYFSDGKPEKCSYTLEKSVPSDAKFTDTTYSVATTSTDGLESASDKSKLDETNIAYGTCSTSATTAEKVITINGNTNWTLKTGAMIIVKFTNTNTASNPTLNVNGTGAKPVYYNISEITTSNLSYAGYANRYIKYMYNGSQYVFIGWSVDTNTTYSNASLGQGYGTCSTAESTVAKVVTLSGYSLVTNGIVAVKFTYAVPANSTMNINAKGAKAIYYRGVAIVDGVIEAGDLVTFIYNGTNYHLLSIDRTSNSCLPLSGGTMNEDVFINFPATGGISSGICLYNDDKIYRTYIYPSEIITPTLYAECLYSDDKKVLTTAGGILDNDVYLTFEDTSGITSGIIIDGTSVNADFYTSITSAELRNHSIFTKIITILDGYDYMGRIGSSEDGTFFVESTNSDLKLESAGSIDFFTYGNTSPLAYMNNDALHFESSEDEYEYQTLANSKKIEVQEYDNDWECTYKTTIEPCEISLIDTDSLSKTQYIWDGVYTNLDYYSIRNNVGYENGTYQTDYDFRIQEFSPSSLLVSNGTSNTVYGIVSLGNSTNKWNTLYAASSTIVTSDRTQKTNIVDLDDNSTKNFIMALKPSSFKFVDGTSGRTHYGLIAQDVEDTMTELGMESTDFAGFIKSPKIETVEDIIESPNGSNKTKRIEKVIEGEYNYSLRYEEFIAPLIKMVQMQEIKINELTNEIEKLKNQ